MRKRVYKVVNDRNYNITGYFVSKLVKLAKLGHILLVFIFSISLNALDKVYPKILVIIIILFLTFPA